MISGISTQESRAMLNLKKFYANAPYNCDFTSDKNHAEMIRAAQIKRLTEV